MRRDRRQYRPALDGLESRQLLAARPAAAAIGGPTAAPSASARVTPPQNLGPLKPDVSLVARVFAPVAYPPTVAVANADNTVTNIPNPQPTAAELAREYFTAEFTGTYTVTPGHFAGQAATIKLVSKGLRSNQFLHGKAQVIIATPADASASFFGTAALIPQSALNSGESVVLDLEGHPKATPDPSTAPIFDSHGLPAHLVWQPDTASGSAYTGATGTNQGYGYMDAVYTPDRRPQKGTLASGKVTALFQGLYNTAGILNEADPATQ